MSLRPAFVCLNCGYRLEALPEPRCPECGQQFDPNDPETYGHPQVDKTDFIPPILSFAAALLYFSTWTSTKPPAVRGEWWDHAYSLPFLIWPVALILLPATLGFIVFRRRRWWTGALCLLFAAAMIVEFIPAIEFICHRFSTCP